MRRNLAAGSPSSDIKYDGLHQGDVPIRGPHSQRLLRARQAYAMDRRELRCGPAVGQDGVRGAAVPRGGGREHPGARRGPSRASTIGVALERSESQAVLEIEDDGARFDPNEVATPLPAQSLEAASLGGRGIHLIRQFSSRMDYLREGRLNRLRLTFASG